MAPFVTLLASLATAYAVFVPGPTGPLPVTMSTYELTDPHRLDPYAPPGDPHLRRIMISVFLPAGKNNSSCQAQVTPYMTPLTAAAYNSQAVSYGLPNETFFDSFAMQFCKPAQCSKTGSPPVNNRHLPYPLVLFSPGSGHSRLLYGGMAGNLASYGYAVITIDHPYDAVVVEFLDGTAIYGADIPSDNTTALEESVNVSLNFLFIIVCFSFLFLFALKEIAGPYSRCLFSS